MTGIMDRLATRMMAVLKAYHVKVATAESCTGGLVAKMLTDYDGASLFFEGCVVAYTPALKNKVLGVPAQLIADEGVVSAPVAEAMAKGVCELTGSKYGIGITGIAGPGGATELHPVGTIFISVFNGERFETRKQGGDTDTVITTRELSREFAARNAISMLCDMIETDYGKVEGYEDDYLRQ